MNLKDISLEINDLLEKRRKELELRFIEDKHIYFMRDIDGKVKKNFPSVSQIIKHFHEPFDSKAMSLKKANGDPVKQQEILNEWSESGRLSINIGSRTHYLLEKELIGQYGNYKELREPEFVCNDEQIIRSDKMVLAGNKFIDLMHERGAVLLDTETVLGDPELEYTGQPDKSWLMLTKDKKNFGVVLSDWKTNQLKNFEIQWYTKKMFSPFNNYPDTSLYHYFIQIPLYGRLLTKMLKDTKFNNVKFLGGVVVLLLDNGEFNEYKIPQDIVNKVMNLNLKKYIDRRR